MTDKSPLFFALNACKWEKQSKNIFFSIFKKKHLFDNVN